MIIDQKKRKSIQIGVSWIALALLPFLGGAQTREELYPGFLNPPSSAMPRTWWHWTKGNVTKEGITKDLEWMKSAGIAGFQLADVASGSGQETPQKVDFGSPEWLDAVRHAGKEAERLNLEMTSFSSAGWSLTGGPWVKPQEAMKKLVWSELQLTGGKKFHGKIPHPPTAIGPFSNMTAGGRNAQDAGYYADVAVLAFKTPTAEQTASAIPHVSTSSGSVQDTLLWNEDLNDQVSIRPDASGKAWICYAYDQPFTARSLTLVGPKGIPYGTLSTSQDGKHFTPLLTLPGKQGYRGGKFRTFSFAPITAKYYRMDFSGAPMTPAQVISEAPPTPDSTYLLSQLLIQSGARVHRWEDKAGFNFLFEYEQVQTPSYNQESYIRLEDIVDLSDRLQKDGSLDWTPPSGNWTILRFGFSLTGAKNRPAVPAGLGYEVDKLSKEHTLSYMQSYTGLLKQALGDLYGTRLTHIMMDSWEAGIQNWTDRMMEEFQQRRHYDMRRFLPALAGRIVENADASDRFLWDFRRTLVDLFAENHYKVVTDFLHAQGLKTYSEAGGVSLESIEDALLNKKYVDIPMGEFWVKDLHPSSMYEEDVKGAVSASHIYGKKLTAAEAFTGGNYESPYTLKKIADRFMAAGINRLVFHTSAHQPLETNPGNTMVGTHIHRHITWAQLAKPFTTYLSRTSYLLQQGISVADLAYLLPEGAPATMPFWGGRLQPTPPKGYQYDYMNADALLTRLRVDAQGHLVTPDGLQYKALVLPNSAYMSIPVIQKLTRLVDSGATIVGPKPLYSPSLSPTPSPDTALTTLATELWGDLDGQSRTIFYKGKGKVFWGRPLAEVLQRDSIAPDLDYEDPLKGQLYWSHRKIKGTDCYFLVNGSDQAQTLALDFRIMDKYPEIWSADKGERYTITSQKMAQGTRMSIHFEARESLFVLFSPERSNAPVSAPQIAQTSLPVQWKGPWSIQFPTKNQPQKLSENQLRSWTAIPDSTIKYFAGTAVYTNSFVLDKPSQEGKIFLDLGKVGDLAQVFLNGTLVDTLWKAPYAVDVSKYLKPGTNKLEIRVTNEWTNRLVGDQLLPENQRVLDAWIRPFGGKYDLQESGLMGPIRLYQEQLTSPSSL